MNRRSVFFTGVRQVEVREEVIPAVGTGQALVKARLSAISPGTEMLIYRNQAPKEMASDEAIEALGGSLAYPLKYGYALIGEVVELGEGVAESWLGRLVFVFNPHESYLVTGIENLIPLPEGIEVEDAVFLPNMETAVNFIMDGGPMMGEKVAVFGQGIMGLLTTALLSMYPLESLVTFDLHELRRKASLELGADLSLAPEEQPGFEGADLVYELSGAPQALDQAIGLVGFHGRVLIGSWYGEKRADLNLGGDFHRKRIRLISSQVSTLTPELSGRWDKQRRFEMAWEMIRRVKPSRYITQRFPVAQAAEAYRLLDQHPDELIQVVLSY